VKVCYQLCVVDPAEALRVLFQLRKRLAELRPRPVQVTAAEVVHPDRRLDQTLVKQAQRTASRPPKILPGFVGFEVPAVVKKNYSVLQEVAHRSFLLSY
jgi:hypothetical protein